MVRHTVKSGFSFGLTSATITTLGLMVGLESGTRSSAVVIGGIITIAIADAFSDAMGIHVSKESENRHSNKEVWEATIATFGAKLLFALTFAVPVLLLPLSKAIIVGVAWGLSLLGIFSFHLAQIQKIQPWKVILEHLFLALAVVIITHFVGDWVRVTFV